MKITITKTVEFYGKVFVGRAEAEAGNDPERIEEIARALFKSMRTEEISKPQVPSATNPPPSGIRATGGPL